MLIFGGITPFYTKKSKIKKKKIPANFLLALTLTLISIQVPQYCGNTGHPSPQPHPYYHSSS